MFSKFQNIGSTWILADFLIFWDLHGLILKSFAIRQSLPVVKVISKTLQQESDKKLAERDVSLKDMESRTVQSSSEMTDLVNK